MKFMSSGKRPFLIQRLTQHACIERVTGLGKSNRKSELSECTFFFTKYFENRVLSIRESYAALN